jgi:xanthine dehydrogenase accessory factor
LSAATWLEAACRLLRLEPVIVRITVAETRGSTPRERGATMLVTEGEFWGTIGGGNLEWQAIEHARRWMSEGRSGAATLVEQRLGPDLAQCCGGAVVLWVERIPRASLSGLEKLLDLGEGASTPATLRTISRGGRLERITCEELEGNCRVRRRSDGIELRERRRDAALPLLIFGAGHVGQAVLRVLKDLPLFDVLCVDSRPALLPRPGAHIRTRYVPEPVDVVAKAAAGTAWLVMTHDHELDYQICAAVLARGDARWLGLIGSASKAARFRSRLARDGFSAEQILQLCSPVGIAGVPGKLPAAIAVSIVAQLLTLTAERPVPVTAQACDPDCRRCAAPLADLRLADLPS